MTAPALVRLRASSSRARSLSLGRVASGWTEDCAQPHIPGL